MALLKRVNVHLDEQTIPELKGLIKKIQGKEPWGFYGLTASDLIRLAIKDCYGIGSGFTHCYDINGLRERIRKAVKKSGGK